MGRKKMQVTRRGLLATTAAAAMPFGRSARAQGGKSNAVRIGVLSDMSGPYRDVTGPTSAACARQAIEDFGAHGFTVELVTGDHQNKPDIGAGIARQWFDRDGVDMITDVPTSSVALAVNTVAKEKNKAYINTGAGTADLTGKQCTPVTVHWGYDVYMNAASTGGALFKAGGDTWFFITADYVFGQQLQRDTAAVVTKLGGKVLGNAAYAFPGTTDFSSFLVQAQASGAKVLGLANAGDDTVNCVKQAKEFGLTRHGTRIAALVFAVTGVHGLGLEDAQGLRLTESFYWDLNDRTRAFTKRVLPKTPDNYPNAVHAACYAGTLHYLKSVAALGLERARDGAAVVAHMKATPAEDDAFGRTVIRADGRAMVTPYLFEVKAPSESRGGWDYYKLVTTTPADEAAPPVTQCPLIRA
jgi:branched-chain amino acid transport system substrate-binding protein